jgi:4-amino-4-deoxy-L-arabinose transferase-like glycosyltransferase
MKILNLPISSITAALLLFVMTLLMLVQASQWTTTMDESPHIVSGYSYLTNRDYRLNPEHPPLIKMIAGLGLLFQNINFPLEHPGWTDGITKDEGQWGQWSLGNEFLHWAGNDPVSVTFWARIGMIAITILLGVFIFKWAIKLYGAVAAVFALILFSFSPNFLAHGHLVTTDVGAAFAFLFATYFFLKYLRKQTSKNLVIAGIAFGIANLMKFSLILLIPYFFILAMAWVLLKDKPMDAWATAKRMFRYSLKLMLIGVIALAVIYPFYLYTTWNYPPKTQLQDTQLLLRDHNFPKLADAVMWMADKPFLRAMGHFFLGHLMVFQRVAGGNTVYYMGEVSSTAWASYFPVVFALKVPIALLIMLLIASVFVCAMAARQTKIVLKSWPDLKDKARRLNKLFAEWGREYFIEFSFALFLFIYWTASITSNLNIGLRHVLPTFPFMYLLLAGIFNRWMNKNMDMQNLNWMQQLRMALRSLFGKWLKSGAVVVLLLWYIGSALSVFPHTLAYFNELAGGPDNGYKFVVDSNLDWGQDLRGLVQYVEKNNIEKIKLDYFGGGNPTYYLGDKYEKLNPADETQRNGWIAISATPLQNGRGVAAKGFGGPTEHYAWLNKYEPVDKIGYSIFVYFID